MRTHRSTTVRRISALVGSLALATALAGCNNASGSEAGGDFPSKTIEFMVPAAAGGGWDTTARVMQKVIQDEDLVDESVEVFNVEGGGGATGLAQLQKDEGDPEALMMTGLVMIGALEQADSQVSLDNTTPIATLTKEAEAFVVPADSKYQSIQDVVDDYLADPESVVFGGGSAGGAAMVDEMPGTEAWKTALADNGWTDFYTTGDDAKSYIDEESERVAELYDEIGL